MAKNNFKKKKTLKRSLRRNHTKKVASASLGSRTPNIRKKNRRSQKQRATLRNKRNARAKIGGVLPHKASSFLNMFKKTREIPELAQEELKELKKELEEEIKIINKKPWNNKTSDDRDVLELNYIIDQNNIAATREQEEQEKELTKTKNKFDLENYYKVIEPMLNHIYQQMPLVKKQDEARHLFEAANDLIEYLLPIERSEVKANVMKAWDIPRAKYGWPEKKGGWYYSNDLYLTPAAENQFDPYVYPPEIIQKSKDIMNNVEKQYRRMGRTNPYLLRVHSYMLRDHSAEASIEPLSVDDTTSKSTNPTSLSSITPQNIPSPSGDPLPGGVPTSKPSNPTPLFSVKAPSTPSDTREIRVK
jgi:hypothetical protein